VTQRPFVLLSAAMSADGYLDDATPNRLVLSGEADLDRVDELRAACDAILVGAQTVRSDNPRLLVRSAELRAGRVARGRAASPRKVTITRSGSLDPASRFFTARPPAAEPAADEADRADGDAGLPLVYASAAVASDLSRRLAGLAEVVPVAVTPGTREPGAAEPGAAESGAAESGAAESGAGDPGSAESGAGNLDLVAVLADLRRRGVERLMVEGGARILSEFLAAGLADEFWLAIAPIFVADPRAPRLLAGGRVSGRMSLAGLSEAGDIAVLRYLPQAGSMA
jgi:5-amino-6-(5-phosphoribosylamino)uracil reductase